MNRKHVFRLTPIAFAVVTLSVQAQQAPSAQVASTLPAVEVSADSERQSSPKATARLLDTPQTVQIIPKEIFNEQGARNLTEVLRNTPGISFNGGENGFGTSTANFSLRGFDTSANIFVDGFRDSGTYNRDAFNIEQVEVIKGPAADNGRGGAGGYVNLQTKAPKLQNFATGTATYGFDNYDSHDRYRITADINRVLSESSAFRLNLLTDEGGVPGRAYAKNRSFGIAPSISFGLNTPTTVTLSYQHLKMDDRPDWGVPGAMVPGMVNYNPVAASASRDNFYGLLSDFNRVTSDSFLARIEHRLAPNLTLSNHTRIAVTDQTSLFTAPTAYAAGTQLVTTQRWGYARQNKSISNNTNLLAVLDQGDIKHTIAVGVDLTREESDAGRYPSNVGGNPGSTNVFNPNPGRPLTAIGPFTPSQTADVKINTVALYAYDTIEFNPAWQVTGGVRAERYSVDLQSRTAAGASLGPADGFDRSETTVGGKLGVVYKPATNGSVYASYGVSALPPGSYLSGSDISREGDNAFPGVTGMNHRNSKPQKATNIEVGTKWDFMDKRLTTTAAVFRTERSDIAMGPALAEPVGYGKQVVQGVELGVLGTITPAWKVSGGIMFLDSERKHSAAIDAALVAANPGDYTGTKGFTNGDELAFTPKRSANFWTTYRFPFGLTVGGGAQHVGSAWLGRPDTADRVIPNGRFGKLPSYTIYNLMAAYELSPKVTLRFNIDNVTNELYANSSNWNGSRAQFGPSRLFLVSADIKF